MADVKQIIEARKELYLDWLVRLCRQPSIAAQNVGMAETAALVETLLQNVGAEAHQVATAGYPFVFGELGDGPRTLAFYNHYDVQPADPLEEWHSDPFAADIRNGTLYARGVSDNKGNLVARIAAVDAYQRAYGDLPVRVKFIVEGEEEIGSPNVEQFAAENQELIAADGCVWEAGYSDPAGRREVYLGVKGILYVELAVETANVDLHSSWASIVPSAPWHLLAALRSIKDEQDRITIPGFYDAVRELTAADEEALATMPFDEAGYRAQLGLDVFVNELSGQPLLRKHIFQPTANIAGLWSGYTGEGLKTVLPHVARAKMDFRLVPDQDPHELFERLRAHLDQQGFVDVEVTLLAAEHPARTSPTDPFAKMVVGSFAEVYGHEPVVYPIVPGTGPMYVLCQRYGIPAVSLGVGNADSRNHAPNENIHLKDFYDGIAHIVRLLERFPTLDE